MGKFKQEYTKKLNETRQSFLLTFFKEDEMGFKEVNGFYLMKHKNGNTGGFEVAIYTEESYKNAQAFTGTLF